MQIRDKNGQVIYEGGEERYFDDLDLRDAAMEGLTLQGASFCDTNLAGASLRGADFYWAVFFRANLANADLVLGFKAQI